ncbi:MAG: YveK family protein [Lachnospiraceae bacterium]
METNQNIEDEIEIDLGLIISATIRNIWVILLSGVVVGLAVYIVSGFFMTKQYESTAQLYIISRQNEGTTTYSDLQAATQIVKDYKVLVVSRPVVEQVISNLILDMSTKEFTTNVSADIESDSRVLKIAVTNPDPYMAKNIVDNLADVSSRRICDVMQIDGVNIIEYGNIPTEPSSPKVLQFTVIGMVIGMLLAFGVVVLITILDDSIKCSEDIEKYLGISTLALIPLTEGEYDGTPAGKKKKKKKKAGK